MRFILILLLILIVFLPTFNVGGIPLRIEDPLIVFIFLHFIKELKFVNNSFSSLMMLFITFIALALTSLFASTFNGYIPISQDFNTIFLYIKSGLFLYVGYLLGGHLHEQGLNYLLFSFSIALFLSSCLGIIQYFDIMDLGETTYLFYGQEDRIEYGITRVIGAFGNPNYAAYFHSIGFVLTLNISARSKSVMLTKYIILVVCFFGVVLTFSRTGVLALFLAWFVVLILQKGYKHIFALLTVILFVGTYYLENILAGTRFSELLGRGDSLGITNFGNRSNLIWTKIIGRFYDNPIIGSGPGKNRISDTVFGSTIYDNSFLLLLVTTGVIGTVVFVLFYSKLLLSYLKDASDIKFKITLRNSIVAVHLLTYIFFFTSDLIWDIHFVAYFYLLSGVSLSFYLFKTPTS